MLENLELLSLARALPPPLTTKDPGQLRFVCLPNQRAPDTPIERSWQTTSTSHVGQVSLERMGFRTIPNLVTYLQYLP